MKRRDKNRAVETNNTHGANLRSRPFRFSEAGDEERPKDNFGPINFSMKFILLMVAAGYRRDITGSRLSNAIGWSDIITHRVAKSEYVLIGYLDHCCETVHDVSNARKYLQITLY